jgi:antitoxin component YwqK of YwqJK toxin-antitoxin module
MKCSQDSSSSGKVGPMICKYWLGKKRVTKEEYDQYLLYPNEISKCKPCYLIKKVKGKVTYEGEFYQDCGIGVYIERYPSGKIKLKGQFEGFGNGNIYEYANSGKCDTKTGEWFYYKENGEIEKKVLYKDGVEVN